MKNKIQKLWEFIFRNDPSLQNIPLQLRRRSVYIDTKIQKILFHRFLHREEGKSK